MSKYLIRGIVFGTLLLYGFLPQSALAFEGPVFVHRDMETGIYSESQRSISFRNMRHVWIASDDTMAFAVQEGEFSGNRLVLYTSVDGLNWNFETIISNNPNVVKDGIIDADNNIHLVTSIPSENLAVDVQYIRLVYDEILREWHVSPSETGTVFNSNRTLKASRATIAQDTHGVLWCAFRLQNSTSNTFQIRVRYSLDNGITWENSGSAFGARNNMAEKSGKVISAGSKIVLVYQNVIGDVELQERTKEWASRDDNDPFNEEWESGLVAHMESMGQDPYSTHWSVASDHEGNVHMSYQDNGTKYTMLSAFTEEWSPPITMSFSGDYSNISIGDNNDMYLFTNSLRRDRIIVKHYSYNDNEWSRWFPISSIKYDGFLRAASPERYHDVLPLFHTANADRPYALVYNLLSTQP